MVVINGFVHPMSGEPIARGFVRFQNGKITAVGPMDAFSALPGEETFDAGGDWVLPGLVDAHCHLGLLGDGLGFEGDDVNEETDPCTPQLRVIDGANPLDRCFREALEGGVTTVVTSPGSANPVAGQAAAIKTYGRRIDDMLVRTPAAMKFALGENPKTVYNHREETPMTRMGTAAIIREALRKAQDYDMRLSMAEDDEDVDPPDFDMKSEALLPLLHGQMQAHFHAHRADDIFTAIRIAKEFSLDYVIIHGTEGHLVADLLAQEGTRVVTGPCLGDRCKPELGNMTLENPAKLSRAGVLCAICTDHPETPLQHLPLCAAMAVRGGMDAEEALRAITIYPAKITGIADRVGALLPGLDADVVVWSGSPLSLDSRVKAVFEGGTLHA